MPGGGLIGAELLEREPGGDGGSEPGGVRSTISMAPSPSWTPTSFSITRSGTCQPPRSRGRGKSRYGSIGQCGQRPMKGKGK